MAKLISAEALLLSVRDDPEIDGKHFARFKEHINHAPDAVKHGRWEQFGYDKAMDRISCSCCMEYWNIVDNDTESFNYCPNCGARMDGENDG